MSQNCIAGIKKGLTYYIAISYSICNSLSYIYNNIAFCTTTLEKPYENLSVKIPIGIFLTSAATALFVSNFIFYNNETQNKLRNINCNRRKNISPLLLNTEHQTNEIGSSSCSSKIKNGIDIYAAFFKAESMALGLYLLLKKLSTSSYFPIISIIFFPGNLYSQIVLFNNTRQTSVLSSDSDDDSSYDTTHPNNACECGPIVRKNLQSHWIAGSYSISTSFSYIFGTIKFLEYMYWIDPQAELVPYLAISGFAVILLYENWDTYAKKAKIHFGFPNEMPTNKNLCCTCKDFSIKSLAALFKGAVVAATAFLALQHLIGIETVSTDISLACVLGTFSSQLSLFCDSKNTTDTNNSDLDSDLEQQNNLRPTSQGKETQLLQLTEPTRNDESKYLKIQS